MAATVSVASPWGKKPGAWALDAEENEEELQRQKESSQDDSAFPSLAAAAATKQPKKNKKLSLAEFANYSSGVSGNNTYASPRLTHDEILNLPTGPRQRSAEELDRNRLGGGFKSYSSGRGFGAGGGDDSSNSRPSRFSSREGNRERDRERDYAPSRADEVDDWSKTKKSVAGNGYERRERGNGGYFFESQSSKADESDNWVASKATVEARRFSNGGFERRGSFDSLSRGRDVSSNGGGGADSDNWGRKKEENNGTGMGGGVRPRLVLQPRTLPVNNETATGMEVKAKGGSPFGEARPREEVLAEKGKDWKEIDEKLEAFKATNAKEAEKVDGRDSYGWSRDRGRLGNEAADFEKSWRKPDSVGSDTRPQSADSTENGHALENCNSTEDGVAEAN